jgi:hypothetical protein
MCFDGANAMDELLTQRCFVNFGGAKIWNYPRIGFNENAIAEEQCCFVEIGELRFFRRQQRWIKDGVSSYASKHDLVKQMILYGEKTHKISEHEVSVFSAFIDSIGFIIDKAAEKIIELAVEKRRVNLAKSIRSLESEKNTETKTKKRKLLPGYVYLMSHQNGLTKIGHSKHPRAREHTLQAEDPRLFLMGVKVGGRYHEQRLHKIFKKKRIRGEWFDLSSRDIARLFSLAGFNKPENERKNKLPRPQSPQAT